MTEKHLQERDSDEYLATIFSIKPSNVQGGRKAIRAYQQVWRDRERQYGQPEQISKKAFESLPERKRPLADFFIPT
jgi:hypothetical protein|tara:strand:+ start:4504 stop:4731 length:228 start_codon:yes stop_codon:yes gene_type:complete